MSPNNPFITVWQALSPAAVRELQRFHNTRLQPSSFGDSVVLFKCSRRHAVNVARVVWAQRFSWSAVIEITVYAPVLREFPLQSVAYEEHQEYAVPVASLARLSAAMVAPARIVERFNGSRRASCNFMTRSLGSGQAVESFC